MKDRGAADKSTHGKRQTSCAERGSRRGAAWVSERAVAGPGDNIRRTVTLWSAIENSESIFAAIDFTTGVEVQGGNFL